LIGHFKHSTNARCFFAHLVWDREADMNSLFAIAASLWNIVVTRLEGRMSLMRGPEMKATMADCRRAASGSGSTSSWAPSCL
jgi:hypothetical protein